MANEEDVSTGYREDLVDATRNFRRSLLTLQREHLKAYQDARMRCRLAYIRYLDNLIRVMTYRRVPLTNTVFRVANNLLRVEMSHAENEDIDVRRQSFHISMADILSEFNNDADNLPPLIDMDAF